MIMRINAVAVAKVATQIRPVGYLSTGIRKTPIFEA